MMKNWTMFMIAIGLLLTAVSPQLPSPLLYVGLGLILIIAGFIKLIKRKRVDKTKNK